MMCHGVMVAPVSVILDHYINLPTKLPFSSLKACTNAIPHFGTELDNILFKIHILYISKTTILGINLDILLLELHPLNLNKKILNFEPNFGELHICQGEFFPMSYNNISKNIFC